MDNLLRMLGLALRAGKLEVGEEPAGAACAAKRCRLLLTASDAAGNSLRRARGFAGEGQCLLAALPWSREELGAALGRSACAMAAVTDTGFAAALAEKLAAADPETYGETARRLQIKAARRRERQAAGVRRPGKKKK